VVRDTLNRYPSRMLSGPCVLSVDVAITILAPCLDSAWFVELDMSLSFELFWLGALAVCNSRAIKCHK
jgi:hypothetical protein